MSLFPWLNLSQSRFLCSSGISELIPVVDIIAIQNPDDPLSGPQEIFFCMSFNVFVTLMVRKVGQEGRKEGS